MGPSGRIAYIGLLGQVNAGLIQELYLGRALRTKKTPPDFLKWRRVTRRPLVFRELTGSQRTRVLGCHSLVSELRYPITCSVLGMSLGYGVVV